MAFSHQKRRTLARHFGLSEDQLERAAGRMAGHLSRVGRCDAAAVLSSLQFFVETIEEARAARERATFAYQFRDPARRKYQIEIVRLHRQGYGAKRISDAIAARKGPRIPKTSIERFLRENGLFGGHSDG